MKDIIAPLNFSTFIAYLLPGFVAFYSFSYISNTTKMIFDALLTKDSQLGAGFLILVASSIAGVIVSAVRGLILDSIQEKTGVSKPSFKYSSITDPSVHEAFKDAISNTYRFAQSYGNMSMSFAIFLLFKYAIARHSINAQLSIFFIICTIVIILFICYRSYLRTTYEAIDEILKKSEKEVQNEEEKKG